MKVYITVLVILTFLIFLFHKAHGYIIDDRVSVTAFDGKSYKVRNIPAKQESADALARVNQKMISFIDRLVKETDDEHKAMVYRIKTRYDPDGLSEGRLDKKYTSYTINKEHVVLCLRTRDEKDEMYDDNVLFYVALHELGHIGSISVDPEGESHGPEFHKNFRYILKKASEWDMWKRVTSPFNYCGVNVQSM